MCHLLLLSAFSSPGVHSASNSNKWAPRNFLVGKVRPAGRADKSAFLIVQNVKERMEAQRSIFSLSLQDLLRESSSFLFARNNKYNIQTIAEAC
jgi:hypothetical protein